MPEIFPEQGLLYPGNQNSIRASKKPLPYVKLCTGIKIFIISRKSKIHDEKLKNDSK